MCTDLEHPRPPADLGHAIVGRAIAEHTAAGRTVSVPIGDAPYDLVVDVGGRLTCVGTDGSARARPTATPTDVVSAQPDLFGGPDPQASRRGPAPPAPTGIARDNPRDQGALGFGDAVGWFASHGFVVSIPLIDNQPYDLIVDDGHALARVQVKTTRHRTPYGVFVVSVETAGGNQSFHTRKPFDPSTCEVLYVLTDAGDRYVVPTATIRSRHTMSLGARVARYRVT